VVLLLEGGFKRDKSAWVRPIFAATAENAVQAAGK
jgi:hypothetical protein